MQLAVVPVSDPRWSLLLTPESQNVMSDREAAQFTNMLRRLDALATAARDCACHNNALLMLALIV